MARFYGGQHVAQVYLVRHIKHGVLTDCAYAERPTQDEMRATCEMRGYVYQPGWLLVVEVPLVSALDTRADGLACLDEWEPPPVPETRAPVEPMLDPSDPANILRWRAKVSGVGHVRNPGE
jgi:hypothetical protein